MYCAGGARARGGRAARGAGGLLVRVRLRLPAAGLRALRLRPRAVLAARDGPAARRAEPVRAEPVRAEPVRAEPVRAVPVRAVPVRAKPLLSRAERGGPHGARAVRPKGAPYQSRPCPSCPPPSRFLVPASAAGLRALGRACAGRGKKEPPGAAGGEKSEEAWTFVRRAASVPDAAAARCLRGRCTLRTRQSRTPRWSTLLW